MKNLTPEEQIEKDKDAISKMIGAKSAMESALREIERLRKNVERIKCAHDDCMKAVGHSCAVLVCRGNDGKLRSDGARYVKVENISAYIASIAEESK